MNNYDTCKCGNNPAINEDKFTMKILEFGSLDKVIKAEYTAICKDCSDEFTCKIGKEGK